MSNIFVTGYYGTGSSAIIDLLTEFDNIEIALGKRYEHVLFLCHDGLLDLEQRLFGENSNQMIRDVAINEFIKEMYKQNDHFFGWYGSYRYIFGQKFKALVDKFVDNISAIGGQDLFSHTTGIRYSPIKAMLQIGAAILKGYKITKLGRVYVYDKKKTRYLIVDHDTFIRHAQQFVSAYFQLCYKQNHTMIYDHILLPEQCGAMHKFFPEDKLIIVDRDPRDVYFSAYHVWNSAKFGAQQAPFPLGVEAFCSNWKMMHKRAERAANSKHVKIIHFEDLVYKTDQTIEDICNFIGLNIENQRFPKRNFDPSKSIKNTQIFRSKSEFKNECSIIEQQLEKYLYEFPLVLENRLEDAWDA